MANLATAVGVCKDLYNALSPLGYYPALTGGSLYKEGERKDIDLVIYRNRQAHSSFCMEDIHYVLEKVGFTDIKHYGFVTKGTYKGLSIDLFNPEEPNSEDGEYCG